MPQSSTGWTIQIPLMPRSVELIEPLPAVSKTTVPEE